MNPCSLLRSLLSWHGVNLVPSVLTMEPVKEELTADAPRSYIPFAGPLKCDSRCINNISHCLIILQLRHLNLKRVVALILSPCLLQSGWPKKWRRLDTQVIQWMKGNLSSLVVQTICQCAGLCQAEHGPLFVGSAWLRRRQEKLHMCVLSYQYYQEPWPLPATSLTCMFAAEAMSNFFNIPAIHKLLENDPRPVLHSVPSASKEFYLSPWHFDFSEKAKYGDKGRFPTNLQYKAHFHSFLRSGYESSREAVDVRFPEALSTIQPFTVQFVDGQNKLLIILSVFALLELCDPLLVIIC